MCRYFYIGFINFRFKGKSLTDFTNNFELFFLKCDIKMVETTENINTYL